MAFGNVRSRDLLTESMRTAPMMPRRRPGLGFVACYLHIRTGISWRRGVTTNDVFAGPGWRKTRFDETALAVDFDLAWQ